MDIVTKDLSKFGYRELKIAGKLLSAYKTDRDQTEYLYDEIAVYMNTHSGFVFLSDGDSNTAMMDGSVLRDFRTCFECGEEGFELGCNCEKNN